MSIPLDLSPFTLVGATTRSGLLPGPLRDRFGFTAHMDFYDPADLQQIVRRAASLIGIEADPAALEIIAGRSRAPPGSPTACCDGSVITHRSTATRAWMSSPPRRRWPCSR